MKNLVLLAVMCVVLSSASAASAQCLYSVYNDPQARNARITQIDRELQGTRVCFRGAILPRNRMYGTVYPSPTRRATLLAERERLERRNELGKLFQRMFLYSFLSMQADLISDPLHRDVQKSLARLALEQELSKQPSPRE